MSSADTQQVTSLVLCGGAGRRMNGLDKPLMRWGQQSMLAHVLAHLPSGPVLISANRSLEEYARFGWPVLTDKVSADAADRFQGPLAGVLAARESLETPWMYVVAGDTPLLPKALPEALLSLAATTQADALCVRTDRVQPLPLLLRQSALATLPAYLATGRRSIKGWLTQLHVQELQPAPPSKWFANINTPAELAALTQPVP